MERVLLKTLAVAFLFILLSSRVYAINFGSIVNEDYAEITNEGSVKFKMLFWNVESESYTLKLSVKESPEDWITIIDPDEFVLNKSVGEEYIKLPYMNENIKAKVVNLFVKANPKSETGNYSVVVEAGIKAPDEKDGINIVPQRLLKFEIVLNGQEKTDVVEDEIVVGSSEIVSEINDIETTSPIENQIDKIYLYLIVMFIAILASVIIYKKS
jgi:hypothetical protein